MEARLQDGRSLIAVPLPELVCPLSVLRILYRSLPLLAHDQRVFQCSRGCGDRLAARQAFLRWAVHRCRLRGPAANPALVRLLRQAAGIADEALTERSREYGRARFFTRGKPQTICL